MTFYQNLIIEIFKIIPFLIIGGITVYIAYRQYKIERSKLKAALSDKRFRIHKEIESLYNLYADGNNVTPHLYKYFYDQISQRHALFSTELNKNISRLASLLKKQLKIPEDSKKFTDVRQDILTQSAQILDDIVPESKIE